MRDEKKKYLSSYLLQETKINRFKNMMELNPQSAEDYLKEIESAILLREKIEKQIKAVDGDILSEVLFQKYVFGKTLENIGYTLNYSTRHIERLHIKALDKFRME